MDRRDLTEPEQYRAASTGTTAIIRPRFMLAELDREYDARGFAVKSLLATRACAGLRSSLLALLGPIRPGFSSTVMASPDLRKQTHEMIFSAVVSSLGEVLTGFRVVLASSVVRSPGSGEDDLPLHQDWSFVDETQASSMSIWLPLEDVNLENGCLRVLPGSHLHRQPLRAIGAGFRYASVVKSSLEQHVVDLPLRAGQATFFDHRLIHGSRPNRSHVPRIAVGLVLLPTEAPLYVGLRRRDHAEFTTVSDRFLLEEDFATLVRGAPPH